MARIRQIPGQDQDADTFTLDAAETISEVFAAIFHEEGIDALNELLVLCLDNQRRPLSREDIKQVAADFAIVGRKVPAYKEAAKLIGAAAKKALPEAKLPPACPHEPTDEPHYSHWYRQQGLPVPSRRDLSDMSD